MSAGYVSSENRITAGFEGWGLSDSLQRRAYRVLRAGGMGSPFFYPSLTNPGCPPPITFIFSSPPTRLNNLPATFCALRSSNVPPFLNNVAFPGADILEVLNTNYGDPQPPASATDAYKLFLLGGKTELQRAREVQPTFVTAWLGNNDVSGAILDTSANAGSAADVTPPRDVHHPVQRLRGQPRLVRHDPGRLADRRGASHGRPVLVTRSRIFRGPGVHPDAHGPPELPGFARDPAGRHRASPGPIPFRRAARGAGSRWNTH